MKKMEANELTIHTPIDAIQVEEFMDDLMGELTKVAKKERESLSFKEILNFLSDNYLNIDTRNYHRLLSEYLQESKEAYKKRYNIEI